MAGFAIHDLALGPGRIGLCPMPGRDGAYGDDLATVLSWRPGLVVTMVTGAELARGAATFPADLAAAGITWRHLPVADFAAQSAELDSGWAGVSRTARALLGGGGRVLCPCMGGCGRSGMAVMRLLVEAGEAPEAALARLRTHRPCAVETEAQRRWAAAGALTRG